MTPDSESRKGIVAALIFSGLFVGLIVGAFIAANFLVDKSDGMVGGVMVLFYALLFALLFAIGAGVAGKLLPRTKARILAWIAAPVGFVFMILIGWGVAVQRSEFNAELEEQYANLLPFEIHVTGTAGSEIESFSYVYADNLVTGRVNRQTCSGSLEGPTRVALLAALRGIEGKTIECRDCNDASTKVVWQIKESLGSISGSEFYVSDGLLAEHSYVRELLDIVSESAKEVGCD